MAFVARRTSDGKVVDHQVLSGRGPHPLLSDDDDEADTLKCYSQRTYGGSSTVRFVDVKSNKIVDIDTETVYTNESTLIDNRQVDDLESLVSMGSCHLKSFNGDDRKSCDKLKIEDDEAAEEKDYAETIATDTETLQCSRDLRSLSSFDSISISDESVAIDNLSTGTFDMEGGHGLGHQGDENAEQLLLSNRTYILNNHRAGDGVGGKNSSELSIQDDRSDSILSWSEMYGEALRPTESRSNIVPSLSLNASESSVSGTSTYYRKLNDEKMDRKSQEAYDSWLSRKEKENQQKQKAAKLERERLAAETELRQRLSRERYDAWCKNKELQKRKNNNSKINATSSTTSLKSRSSGSSGSCSSSGKTEKSSQNVSEEAKQRMALWRRIKAQDLQKKRELRLQKLQDEQLEEQRKKTNESAWMNWVKQAKKRPKPVPLNQGMDSLRGTVSNIYVNPIKWVSNIEPDDSRCT